MACFSYAITNFHKNWENLPLSIFPDPEHELDLLYMVIIAPCSGFSSTASCVQAILVKRLTKINTYGTTITVTITTTTTTNNTNTRSHYHFISGLGVCGRVGYYYYKTVHGVHIRSIHTMYVYRYVCIYIYMSCSFFLPPTPSSNCVANIHALWLKWRGSGVRMMSDIIWGKCAPNTHPKGAWISIFKPNCKNLKIVISPKPYIRSVKNLMTKLAPSTAHRELSITAVHEIQHGWCLPSWKLT